MSDSARLTASQTMTSSARIVRRRGISIGANIILPSSGGAAFYKAKMELAEGVGFEPTVAQHHDGFQDRSLKPLEHPSV